MNDRPVFDAPSSKTTRRTYLKGVAGFALAAIFARTGSHLHVFLAGLALSVAALLVSFINADRPARESQGST